MARSDHRSQRDVERAPRSTLSPETRAALTKLKRKSARTVKCSRCRKPGHYAPKCEERGPSFRERAAKQQAAPRATNVTTI